MKAMILAAGKGRRLLPLTDSMPKALLKINGVPLLQHSLMYLKYYGISDVVINVHHYADQIIEFLHRNNNFGMNINISDERDLLLDTGGGLYKSRDFFSGGNSFLVSACDIITDIDLNDFIDSHLSNAALASLAVKKRNSSRELIFDNNMQLCGWKSNLTGETRMVRYGDNLKSHAFSAIQIIDPRIFNFDIPLYKNKVFSLTDLYLTFADYETIKGYEHNHIPWYEFGRIEKFSDSISVPEINKILNKYNK